MTNNYLPTAIFSHNVPRKLLIIFEKSPSNSKIYAEYWNCIPKFTPDIGIEFHDLCHQFVTNLLIKEKPVPAPEDGLPKLTLEKQKTHYLNFLWKNGRLFSRLIQSIQPK
jgi:hypothetical protein